MSPSQPARTGTSLVIALGILASTIAPILTTQKATAQLFPRQTQTPLPAPTTTYATIPLGTLIPVMYDKAEKIVVAPNETLPVTLKVAANVRSRTGALLIPYGSEVVGQIQPVTGGSQFVAREIVLNNNRRYHLEADSNVISQTQEVTAGTDTSSILKGAAIGGAAAAAIAGITGNRSIEIIEVIGGAGLGALGGLLLGGNRKADVVVINPSTDLRLTLRSSLALR